MKIVLFKGGLGNQMFQYLLCHYLKDNRECKVFGFYREKDMSEHNGLELTNAFINIKLPKQSLLTLIIVLMSKVPDCFYIFRNKN